MNFVGPDAFVEIADVPFREAEFVRVRDRNNGLASREGYSTDCTNRLLT
jgi:hypothetical protein